MSTFEIFTHLVVSVLRQQNISYVRLLRRKKLQDQATLKHFSNFHRTSGLQSDLKVGRKYRDCCEYNDIVVRSLCPRTLSTLKAPGGVICDTNEKF